MVIKDSKYGKYGIMELLPMEYLREFARGKDPSIKVKTKLDLIQELINRDYVTDQDLVTFNHYYESIINKEKSESVSIVKLSKAPDIKVVSEFLAENKYEYDPGNQMVSKDGFDIKSTSPLKFYYWYDIKKLIRNPDNSIKEEHIPEKVEVEYKEDIKTLFFYTPDTRKVSRVMNNLVPYNNLNVATQIKSLNLEESYKKFEKLLKELDKQLQSHNSEIAPYDHVISWIQLFDGAQKNIIQKIRYESKVDILNNSEIVDKRKKGYFLVGIGGYLFYYDVKYTFRISLSREYPKWGDALTISARANTESGSDHIKEVFNILMQLALEILM